MRFSTSFLAAAGLSALAFAAPISQDSENDDCDYEPEVSSSAAVVAG
jgi:hypothetical protein